MEKENQLYTKIANKIAIPIYEIIKNSGILQSNDLTKIYNENYLMYNLFLYFFSEIFSNIFSTGREIEFDDVAEIRADGGNNIICAVVTNNLIAEHECENGEILLGPCYNSSKNEKDKTELKIFLIHDIQKQNRLSQIVMYVYDNILNSLNKIVNNQELSIDGKTELIERNLAKNKNGKIVLRIPVLYEGELTKKITKELIELRNKKYLELEDDILQFKKYILAETPKHLQKQQEYLLQESFPLPFYVRKVLFEKGILKELSQEELESTGEMFIIKKNM